MNVHFSDSQPGTTLFCNDWGIEVALPATVELQDHIVTYQFEVIDDTHPVGDPLMYFMITAASNRLECVSVNWYKEKCGKTSPPGVVVNPAEKTVHIYSGVKVPMALPKPVIQHIKTYNCEEGFCSYHIYYSPNAPAGANVTVLLNENPVETGDAEGGRIDVSSAEGVGVSVRVMFYENVTMTGSISDPVGFMPTAPAPKDPVKLTTPKPYIATLQADYVNVKWNAVRVAAGCNASPGEKMMYDIWFDGSKQAARESRHIDFDDLAPGSSHTIRVQAVGRSGWDCPPSDVASISFTTPQLLTGSLHVTTVPTGALVNVNGVCVGGTNMVHQHTISSGSRERVSLQLHLNHFKDKRVNKTLRPGLEEHAVYRLSPADKIRGRTSKDSSHRTVTFTFTFSGPGEKILLLNQVTGQSRWMTLSSSGSASVTIPYGDSFFVPGKQKLVCVVANTADRIRIFKTITIR